jgi:NitT/TauT family transport system substrate-binding protein
MQMNLFVKSMRRVALASALGVATFVTPTRAEPIQAASATRGLSAGPLLMAYAEDLFKKAGVDIDWKFLPNQGPTMAALLSDGVSIGVIGCQGAFDANLAGKHLQLIAGLSTANSLLVVRSDVIKKTGVAVDAPIKKRLQALKGLNIATSPVGTTNYAYLTSYLTWAGLDPKRDINILPAPEPNALLAGLRAGKFDGAAYGPGALEPLLADKSGILWVSLGRGDVPQLKKSIFICAAAKKEFVDSHPKEVAAIEEVFAQATQMMQDKATAEAARETVRKAFFAQMDKTLFDLSYASSVPGYLPGTISEEGFDSLVGIQTMVADKDYSSVKFKDTVAAVAQSK